MDLSSLVEHKTFCPDLGMGLNSKSADKDLKVVMPEKSKACVTAFTKKLVTTFQLMWTNSGHNFFE